MEDTMNKKAILSLLLLSSVTASTVSAGILTDIFSEPSTTQKISTKVTNIFKKEFPDAVLRSMAYVAANKLVDFCIYLPSKLKDAFKKDKKGVFLPEEDITAIKNYIAIVEKQAADLAEENEALRNALYEIKQGNNKAPSKTSAVGE